MVTLLTSTAMADYFNAKNDIDVAQNDASKAKAILVELHENLSESSTTEAYRRIYKEDLLGAFSRKWFDKLKKTYVPPQDVTEARTACLEALLALQQSGDEHREGHLKKTIEAFEKYLAELRNTKSKPSDLGTGGFI